MDHASKQMGEAMKLFNKTLKKEIAQRLRSHNLHKDKQEVSSDLNVSKYVTIQLGAKFDDKSLRSFGVLKGNILYYNN